METSKDKNHELIHALLQYQVESVTEKPVFFNITLEDDSMVPKDKKVDKITIKPIKVRTVSTLIPLLLKISDEDLEKITANKENAFNPESLEIFSKYHDLILEIICIGIHNNKGTTPPWFKEMLEANFTWQDLHVFLNAILFRMGSQSFHNSIILSSRMSPMDDKGIIAMSKNLKTHQSRLTSTPSL